MKYVALPVVLAITIASITAQAAVAPQPIFEKLTNGNHWTWQMFTALPKDTGNGGLQKDQNKVGKFYVERTLAGYPNASVTAYGSKTAPNEVMFYSGGWGTSDSKKLLKLSDIVNTKQLTKLQSNCNFGKIEERYLGKDDSGNRYSGMNYIDYQTVYKWTRPNSTPLYVVDMRGGGYVETGVFNQGINSTILVTPHLNQLGSIIANHGWHKNKNRKSVTCTFK